MSTKSQTVFAICFGLFLAVVVTVSLLFADKLPHATEHITVKETHLETQEDGSVVPVEQEVVKTYLCIDTVSLTAEEAANLYGFDTKQREQLGELLLDRNKDMWDALLLQQ